MNSKWVRLKTVRCTFILLLTVGFPPVLDVGGGFEKRKSNLFSAGKIMNRKISF
jgi:hypothetical protein